MPASQPERTRPTFDLFHDVAQMIVNARIAEQSLEPGQKRALRGIQLFERESVRRNVERYFEGGASTQMTVEIYFTHPTDDTGAQILAEAWHICFNGHPKVTKVEMDMAYRSLYTCLRPVKKDAERLLPLQQLKTKLLSAPKLSYQISELAPLPSTIAGAKTIKSFWDCGGGGGSGQSITLRCEYLIDPTDPRCRSKPIPIQSSGSGSSVDTAGLPRSLSRLQSAGQSPPTSGRQSPRTTASSAGGGSGGTPMIPVGSMPANWSPRLPSRQHAVHQAGAQPTGHSFDAAANSPPAAAPRSSPISHHPPLANSPFTPTSPKTSPFSPLNPGHQPGSFPGGDGDGSGGGGGGSFGSGGGFGGGSSNSSGVGIPFANRSPRVGGTNSNQQFFPGIGSGGGSGGGGGGAGSDGGGVGSLPFAPSSGGNSGGGGGIPFSSPASGNWRSRVPSLSPMARQSIPLGSSPLSGSPMNRLQLGRDISPAERSLYGSTQSLLSVHSHDAGSLGSSPSLTRRGSYNNTPRSSERASGGGNAVSSGGGGGGGGSGAHNGNGGGAGFAGPAHRSSFADDDPGDELPFAMDEPDDLNSFFEQCEAPPQLSMFASRRHDLSQSVAIVANEVSGSQRDLDALSASII